MCICADTRSLARSVERIAALAHSVSQVVAMIVSSFRLFR